jgi:hypothetical protein
MKKVMSITWSDSDEENIKLKQLTM